MTGANAGGQKSHKMTTLELPFSGRIHHLTSKSSRSNNGELKVSIEISKKKKKNIVQLLKEHRFEYVKSFEQPDVLLPNTWIVVRIDGRGFHK